MAKVRNLGNSFDFRMLLYFVICLLCSHRTLVDFRVVKNKAILEGFSQMVRFGSLLSSG